MKFAIPSSKPRNPFVAASLRRVAGPHQGAAGTRRQQAKAAMRRELAGLDHRHHTTR